MTGATDTRTSPRFRSRRFASAFGEVLDLGAGGMSVLHRGPRVEVGERLRLSIRWGTRIAPVDCTVRRVERTGFRRQRIALSWEQPPEGLWAWLRAAKLSGKPPRRDTLLFHRHGRRRAA
ncbi:PilZ domain-containing protein [Phycisphaera mikurensis]|uniref:PilZ domain-containing protein n=1 Tax=Phycisphaera mikurensis (strain NBRC 102666 / KCTC 22515 / FYK2301M01) TaxID=1142394 RepID=I0IF76_PHYMF|nr:PilZ domain-containing protein [Phycisphaera mikurensis]MBB6440690.1 hypothetical protein [Phycisphaera mikurensis]BAM03914.1 hypothetical protein PSMK_17550 [Phycisphaera mikurensis NBRC 102666]